MKSRPLHILVSTTRQWNPGDEFIDLGVRNILSPFLSNNDSWHLWNRNPDLSINSNHDWHFRQNINSNCVTELFKDMVDIVVFSGSPEWLGPRCEPIYDFIDRFPHIPLLLIGVGSASPLYDVLQVQKRVLSRDNTIIITRSRELALQVNHILGFHKATWLPCPATLCSKTLRKPPIKSKIAAILQIPTGPQAIPEDHFLDIQQAITNTSHDIEILAFHEFECDFLSHKFPTRIIRYAESPNNYISWYKQYSAVISTRLHGAISAMSSGTWSCILKRDDFRVNSAAELLSTIETLEPENAIVSAVASIDSSTAYQSEVSTFKYKTMLSYREKLAPFMKGLALRSH